MAVLRSFSRAGDCLRRRTCNCLIERAKKKMSTPNRNKDNTMGNVRDAVTPRSDGGAACGSHFFGASRAARDASTAGADYVRWRRRRCCSPRPCKRVAPVPSCTEFVSESSGHKRGEIERLSSGTGFYRVMFVCLFVCFFRQIDGFSKKVPLGLDGPATGGRRRILIGFRLIQWRRVK